jgi:hypothetical protein
MSLVGFERTTAASEQAKTAHALDLAATVTGLSFLLDFVILYNILTNIINFITASIIFVHGLYIYCDSGANRNLRSGVLFSESIESFSFSWNPTFFTEPDDAFPSLCRPAIGSYPEPYKSNLYSHNLFLSEPSSIIAPCESQFLTSFLPHQISD